MFLCIVLLMWLKKNKLGNESLSVVDAHLLSDLAGWMRKDSGKLFYLTLSIPQVIY
jgi:hypothetical protein